MPAAKRPDRYDYIGISLVALLVVMWVFHVILPPLPPEAEDPTLPRGGPSLPGAIGVPSIGGPPGSIGRPPP